MLKNILETLFRSDKKPERKSAIAVLADSKKEEKHATPLTTFNDPEIEILNRQIGPLEKGRHYQVAFSDMLAWLPRNRHKSDAYKSLCRRMAELGFSLSISSKYQSLENAKNERM